MTATDNCKNKPSKFTTFSTNSVVQYRLFLDQEC